MNRIHNLYIVFGAAIISALIYSLYLTFSYRSNVDYYFFIDFFIQFSTSYLGFMIFYIPLYFIRLINKDRKWFKILTIRKVLFGFYSILFFLLVNKFHSTHKLILIMSVFIIIGYLSVDINIKTKVKESKLIDDAFDHNKKAE